MRGVDERNEFLSEALAGWCCMLSCRRATARHREVGYGVSCDVLRTRPEGLAESVKRWTGFDRQFSDRDSCHVKALGEQRAGEDFLVGEVPVERADSDPCGSGNIVHAEVPSAYGEQLCASVKNRLPVTAGVAAAGGLWRVRTLR